MPVPRKSKAKQTPEQKKSTVYEVIKAIQENEYAWYFRKCLKIKTKESEIVPFTVNQGQRRLLAAVEAWEAKYPDAKIRPTLFIIILKARQIGFSTCVEGLFFRKLHLLPNKIAMVVSFDEPSAVNINEMATRFYQYLPQLLKPASRPARGKGVLLENPKFDPMKPLTPQNDPGLQSKFLVETAANMNAGSSYTINYLHLSEVAKWPGNPKDTMTSLLQAVPMYNSIVVVESTAKGFNYFQELWDKAERGENGYVPIFVAWWEHDEYRMSWDTYREAMSQDGQTEEKLALTEEELELKETYDLSDAQIIWRRWAIAKKCSGDVQQFKQEYPACPEEAFLATGSPVFEQEKVIRRKRLIEARYRDNPPEMGRIDCILDLYGDPVADTSTFRTDPNGWITIYKHPEKGKPYVIGGDIAEGGADWSVGQVLDNITGEQVASWRAHTDTDLFAKQMFSLGHYYNQALIGIEVNFDSHPVKELERLGYPKQYMRQTIDSITNAIQKKHGFRTTGGTGGTRGPIIGDLVTIVREHAEWINDIETLNEMLTFIRDDNGKPQAQTGKHDDCVMALAIAYRIREQQTQLMGYTVQKINEKKIPNDILDDYWNAPANERERLAKKWGLI